MSSKQLSTEDQVIHADIVRCLDIMDSKLSFSAAGCDSEKYVAMFLDSTIAKSFHSTKSQKGEVQVTI